MYTQVPDRLFVQEVLAGKHNSAVYSTNTPLIAEIETEDLPCLRSADYLIGAAGLAIFILSIAFFLLNFYLELSLPLHMLVAAICFVWILGGILFAFRKRAIDVHDKRMQEACVELADVTDDLKTYLARLNERMIKYFNSNNISNSYTLFLLVQIQGLLENRLKKVCILLSNPNRKNLLRVQLYLSRCIGVRDSVIKELGREHQIRISEVGNIIGPLIEYLQENLLVIEAEKARIAAEANENTRNWKAA